MDTIFAQLNAPRVEYSDITSQRRDSQGRPDESTEKSNLFQQQANHRAVLESLGNPESYVNATDLPRHP